MDLTEEFQKIVREHAVRYPLMQPRDFGKLAYQSEFGPEHLIADREQVLPGILKEWETIRAGGKNSAPENIGNGLFRFPLTGEYRPEKAAPLLAELLFRTAQSVCGTETGMERRLETLRAFPVPGMEPWLAEYRRSGCPPVSHSETFRQTYHPHYRLLHAEFACFFPALLAVSGLVETGRPAFVAIDGRCGSGKTGLAALIAALFPCNILHTDDFYLPMDRRPENWEKLPAGNMDLSRFLKEALLPAKRGGTVLYRPYDCSTGTYREEIMLSPKLLTVAEGSYSLHPDLADQYDMKLFLTCSPEEQMRRIRAREGAYAEVFRTRWIPMEERYYLAFGIGQGCTMTIDTGRFFRG